MDYETDYASQSAIDQYIETALWSSTDDEGEPLEDYEVAPETEKVMALELDDFFSLLDEHGLFDKYDEEQLAHDFWLTRNGHGAGFWDGGYPEPDASALTKWAKSFGSVDLYVGDDDLVYQS